MKRYSSCAKDFISVHGQVREFLLKNKEQNVLKKTVITLVFKLKALVICNKSNLDGNI